MRLALACAVAALSLPLVPAHAAPCDVTVASFQFSPASTSVPIGGTVHWCWTGDNHSVTFAGFDSGVQDTGATFSHTFAAAGTFAYHCKVHSSMQGTVVVGNPTPSPTHTSPPHTTPPAHTTSPTPTHKSSPPATSAPPRTTAPPTTAAPSTPPPATRTTAPPVAAGTPVLTTAPAAAAAPTEPAGHSSSAVPLVVSVVAAVVIGGLALLGLRLRTR